MAENNNTNSGGRRSNALDRRHIERRELIARRLLPAVERLLETKSFAEISVDMLVSEANISRSTFYNYFEDKGDLLRALTADVMGAIIDASRAWWMLPPDSTKEDLRDAVAHLVDMYTPHGALMTAVADSTSTDAGVRDEFRAYMERGAVGIAEYIRAGQRAGMFRTTLDAEHTAVWLDWMAEWGLSRMGRSTSGYDPERMVTAFTDVIWKATR